MELGCVAVMATKGVRGQVSRSNTPRRAHKLASNPTCKNLYRLMNMNFSALTSQQKINLARTVLTKSAMRVGRFKNPTTGDFMRLRFGLYTFLKLAAGEAQLAPFVKQARVMLAQSGLSASQIKQDVAQLKVGLGIATHILPAKFTPLIRLVTKIVAALEKSPHLFNAWKWITATPRTVKGNMKRCR